MALTAAEIRRRNDIQQHNEALQNLARKQLQQAYQGHLGGVGGTITQADVDAYVRSTLGGYRTAAGGGGGGSGGGDSSAMAGGGGMGGAASIFQQLQANRMMQDQQGQMNALNQNYAQQLANSNAANDFRYYQALFGRADSRDRILGDLQNYGQSQIDDTNQRYKELGAAQIRDLTSRGLRNSSGVVAVQNRNEEERLRSIGRIQDDIINRRVNTDERQSENVFGTIERRTDVPPNLQQLIALQNGLGQGGFGGYNAMPPSYGGGAGTGMGGGLPGNSGSFGGFGGAAAPPQSADYGWGGQPGQIGRPSPGYQQPFQQPQGGYSQGQAVLKGGPSPGYQENRGPQQLQSITPTPQPYSRRDRFGMPMVGTPPKSGYQQRPSHGYGSLPEYVNGQQVPYQPQQGDLSLLKGDPYGRPTSFYSGGPSTVLPENNRMPMVGNFPVGGMPPQAPPQQPLQYYGAGYAGGGGIRTDNTMLDAMQAMRLAQLFGLGNYGGQQAAAVPGPMQPPRPAPPRPGGWGLQVGGFLGNNFSQPLLGLPQPVGLTQRPYTYTPGPIQKPWVS